MSRSDTDADVIDANRPKYTLGREVSFSHGHGGEVLVGRIASSKQIIYGARTAATITYDIQSSGMTFSNVPEESIRKHPWPTKLLNLRHFVAK